MIIHLVMLRIKNVLQDESPPSNIFSSNHAEPRLESEMKEECDLAGV